MFPTSIAHANGHRSPFPTKLAAQAAEERAVRELAIKLHYAEVVSGRVGQFEWQSLTSDVRAAYRVRALFALRVEDELKVQVAKADAAHAVYRALERQTFDRSQGHEMPSQAVFAAHLVQLAWKGVVEALIGKRGEA